MGAKVAIQVNVQVTKVHVLKVTRIIIPIVVLLKFKFIKTVTVMATVTVMEMVMEMDMEMGMFMDISLLMKNKMIKFSMLINNIIISTKTNYLLS